MRNWDIGLYTIFMENIGKIIILLYGKFHDIERVRRWVFWNDTFIRRRGNIFHKLFDKGRSYYMEFNKIFDNIKAGLGYLPLLRVNR